MKYRMLRFFPVFILFFNSLCGQQPVRPFTRLMEEFISGYRVLDIPLVDFDYREYLKTLPSIGEIEKRKAFFRKYRKALEGIDTTALTKKEQQTRAHLRYQIGLHLERCALERQLQVAGPVTIPSDGLFGLPNGRGLYPFLIRYATGVQISPDEIYRYGLSEIEKIQGKIREIQLRNGFANDSSGWVSYLNGQSFFLDNRDSIVAGYEQLKIRVLDHLSILFEQDAASVPDIDFMSWPNAGPYTPPGMYLSEDDNAYGKAVYQFNFYGGRHNRRAMDWLFLHEAIPGHHFHRFARQNAGTDPLAGLWFAGGTIEGWATYVEYFGEEMGLYRDDWAWLGKWEWDLVRSVRIVLSVGIHDRGWSKAEALAFWKAHVPNQDEIAEREVTRCINWPAQVLTYKIGAKKILELRAAAAQREGSAFDLRRFHTRFLSAGNIPLEVFTFE